MGLRLPLLIAEDLKDALDTLCNFAGFVGFGDGHRVHRFGINSHPFSDRAAPHGNPPDSRAQDY
jgi:hypothetical protein